MSWRSMILGTCLVALAMLSGGQQAMGAVGADSSGESGMGSALSDQLIVWATVLGAVAALPALIEFLMDRRRRREQVALSLDDVSVASLHPRLAGMDDLLEDVADLIDRAAHPQDYSRLSVGNEILIIGGNLIGKKTLARTIAFRAGLDRLVTVHNPRNTDALVRARSVISRYRRRRVMLLLPRLDLVYEADDEEPKAELRALIEATAALPNVLVVGTAQRFEADSPLDDSFGIKLVLPGASPSSANAHLPATPELHRILSATAALYLRETQQAGFALQDLTVQDCIGRMLQVASNPAEIRDIVAICQTTAIYRRKKQSSAPTATPALTPDILELAISRVIVGGDRRDLPALGDTGLEPVTSRV